MKKLYYFIIPALLLGSCQSDPTLETESSPLVRTKVTELQYAQTDKIDVEALNIISPYKFVKKGNLYAFLTPSSAYRFAIYDSENENRYPFSTGRQKRRRRHVFYQYEPKRRHRFGIRFRN